MKAAVVKEASELPFSLSSDMDHDLESVAEHLAEAMDFIVYHAYGKPDGRTVSDDSRQEVADKLMESQEFDVAKLVLKDPIHSFSEEETGFILYIGIEGEASFQVPATDKDGKKSMEEYRLRKGEVMLVPAEVQDFFVVPTDRNTILLEVTAGKRNDIDEYIDPDTEPFLEGEDYEGLEDEEEGETGSGDTGTAGNGGQPEKGAGEIGGPAGRHNMKWN